MKLLLVKTSSLGDVLHTLPAVTDLSLAHPDWELHWLLEPAYAPIAALHPFVRRVWPFSLRDLKRHWWRAPQAIQALRRELRRQGYAGVLDSQGLVKSALLARLPGVPVFGLDRHSAREPLACRAYHRTATVSWDLPATERNRYLFADLLGYAKPQGRPEARLRVPPASRERALVEACRPFVWGFHGSARANKLWPQEHWAALAESLASRGLNLLLPAGNVAERDRVTALSHRCANVRLLPALAVADILALLPLGRAFVGVDTGFSYLASAVDLRGVTLYGPTADEQSPYAPRQLVLHSPRSCAPSCSRLRCALPAPYAACMSAIAPESVLAALTPLLED